MIDTYSTCSWMMLTILYENFTYTLPNKANHVHLPCMQAYSLYAFLPRCTFLHKHLRTCIIQDRKQRIQSSYPRSRRSSSRCSHRRCPRPMRRTLRSFRSAPITTRVPSREASPGAFLPQFANI
jgi:hypothetical protein